MKLGQLLKAWRIQNKMQQKELAALIGISAATLCKLENGEVGIKAATFGLIILYLTQD